MNGPILADTADTGRKRARLARIKFVAGAVLALMALTFAASAFLRARYPWLAWVMAFSEAALVGGLADWFAVVALFRRPAGLPLPHTAIIPENKERIGAQLGTFVEQNFLTPGNIGARLATIDISENVVRWLSETRNSRSAVGAARAYLPLVVAVVDEPDIERIISRVVSEELERLDFAHTASSLVNTLTARRRHQQAVDQVLPLLARWLHANRAYVKKRFSKKSVLTPPWIDSYIVNALVDGMIDLLDEIAANPDHELRIAFDHYLADLAETLESDPELSKKAEDVKAAIVYGREIESAVSSAWRSIKDRVALPAAGPERANEAYVADVLSRLARGVLADRTLLDRMNANVIALIEAGLSRFGQTFAKLIEDVVQRWDTAEVTEKVELELGPDLQFIRLNGTVIGGLAGVALHGVLVAAGIPA